MMMLQMKVFFKKTFGPAVVSGRAVSLRVGYCNDFETKVELESVVITVRLQPPFRRGTRNQNPADIALQNYPLGQ